VPSCGESCFGKRSTVEKATNDRLTSGWRQLVHGAREEQDCLAVVIDVGRRTERGHIHRVDGIELRTDRYVVGVGVAASRIIDVVNDDRRVRYRGNAALP